MIFLLLKSSSHLSFEFHDIAYLRYIAKLDGQSVISYIKIGAVRVVSISLDIECQSLNENKDDCHVLLH